MGDTLPLAADAEPPSESDDAHAKHVQHLVNISNTGDIILSVTFLTSSATLKRARKAALRKAAPVGPPAHHHENTSTRAVLAAKLTIPYRVSLASLTKHSLYFRNLLTNPSFQEAQRISSTHAALVARGTPPSKASPLHLPWVSITDDDEATQTASRQEPLEDMLRIMHGLPIVRGKTAGAGAGAIAGAGAGAPAAAAASRVTSISYVTTLAIIADRFDSTPIVTRGLADLKFKWPITSTRPYVDEAGRATDVEAALRQKILLAWLLNQPLRLHRESRELIIRGSRLWGAYPPDGEDEADLAAAWWNLPEGIEEELRHRRYCILHTISSIQRHFLAQYSSRHRQCKLGYDSSAACDSFQLGQILKFLLSRDLLSLADYAPSSLDSLPDRSCLLDIDDLLATLKQCPNYQVDKHHLNCGLRIRIDPILDYVKAMLAASVVSLPLADWKNRRGDVSWVVDRRATTKTRGGHNTMSSRSTEDDEKNVFAFTRSLASDERLRYEGTMHADGMARRLFTAEEWDWTPEG
ncbi:hypothetical protein E4U43_003401 [Claviceps pusilla]|uniref:Uncharacterized protein n=1 Tax=Claviceps pusilla TaxID=123648 RepID=A0A9P7N764_9HYPO|nr:hypothetical protein E4U43_003401 [Claviceps pusilla]